MDVWVAPEAAVQRNVHGARKHPFVRRSEKCCPTHFFSNALELLICIEAVKSTSPISAKAATDLVVQQLN
jgi:hypothetical protein